MMQNLISTEYEEQVMLVQWLELHGLKYFHVPNSTWTKSYNQKRRNKALGVSAGVPDIFVALPSIGLLAIEMKRTKGSVTSQAQKDWIDTLNSLPGVQAFIAKGADQAIAIVSKYLPIKQTASTF